MLERKKVIATQVIEDVVNRDSSDRIPVKDLIDAMNSVGFGLAIMIFAFGIIIPLPPPFPSIISIPLVVFAIQMIMGYDAPRLPQRFSNLSVKRAVLATLVRKSSPYIRRVEAILRPRLSLMTSKPMERVIGFFILTFAIFILLPMPLSNFIPGLGILIMSFGLLGKDGVVVIVGIIVGSIGIAISITAVLMGVEALYYLKNLFFAG